MLNKKKYFDLLILVLIIASSLIFYFTRLGFYSDDWDYLARMSLSDNQSLKGIFYSIETPHTRMRPVHLIYFSVLYKLFGLSPLGYHLTNSLVLLLTAVLFYLVLNKLALPRFLSLSIPLVYATLPNYSATRFWFASFQINISILFLFLSLYAGLAFLQSERRRSFIFPIVNGLFFLFSALSYEVALPLFLFNIAIYWKIKDSLLAPKKKLLTAISIFTLVYVVLFKLVETTRLESGQANYLSQDFLIYTAYIVKSALSINFIHLALYLPESLVLIFAKSPDLKYLILSIALGLFIFFYLYRQFKIFPKPADNVNIFGNLIVNGFIIFFLGYSIFFFNKNIGFYAFGIGNRVAVAASIGIASLYVGFAGWVSLKIRSSKIGKIVFSLIISLIVAGNILLNNLISNYWIGAYAKEQVVLSDIRKKLPKIKKNSVILLDGICPYFGPAVVFESSWDLKSALNLFYRDQTIRADVVKANMIFKKEGIYSKIYNQKQYYPYKNLLIYNFRTKKASELKNFSDAENYFLKVSPGINNNCASGVEGKGESFF